MNTNQWSRPISMSAAIAAGLFLQACSSAPLTRADASDWKQFKTVTIATLATQSPHNLLEPDPRGDQSDWKRFETTTVPGPGR